MQNTEPLRDSRPSGSNKTAQSPRYVPVLDLAEVLEVSRVYLYRLIRAGVIPGRRAGRSYGVLAAFYRDVLAAINAGRTVDVEAFAADWKAFRAAEVAS